LFKNIILTREWTDNQGIQKLKKLLKTGTAAMFICTKRKKQVLLGSFFCIKRTTFLIHYMMIY